MTFELWYHAQLHPAQLYPSERDQNMVHITGGLWGDGVGYFFSFFKKNHECDIIAGGAITSRWNHLFPGGASLSLPRWATWLPATLWDWIASHSFWKTYQGLLGGLGWWVPWVGGQPPWKKVSPTPDRSIVLNGAYSPKGYAWGCSSPLTWK